MPTYLIWLIIFVILPLSVLGIKYRKILRDYYEVLILCVLGAFTFSTPWDLAAVERGIWYFPEKNMVGVWILGLPIEEYLFYALVTLLVSTTTLISWKKWGEPL